MATGFSNAIVTLGTETVQWFIRQLRGNGIKSPTEMKNKQQDLGPISYEEFHQKSHTEKFEIPKAKAEGFIRKYFGDKRFAAEDIEALVTYAEYVERGSVEKKVFTFLKEDGGEYCVFYVALLVEGDNVFMAMTRWDFVFKIAPTYKGWWIFVRKEYPMLTPTEKQLLDSFFMIEALRSFYQSMPVELDQLPDQDRKFLEFSN